MGATEKKVALVISFKTEGGQVIAVNLKNIGDAQEQAAKKTVIHTKALEDMGRKVLGFLQFKLAVKAVKEVSQALSELSTYSLGFMSASAPLRAGFDESSSRMKLGFAQVTSVALPAVIGFQKAIGDALDELGTFVDKNRELVATNIAEWAGDAGRAIITGIALAASVANKALHGLTSGISTVKAIALGFAASLGEGEKDSIFTARAKQLRTESDLAWASASRSMREMDAYDAKIKVIEEKTKSYVGTAVASAKEIAKNKVTVSDPEKDAAALSAKEREIARHIELATQAKDKETALGNATLAWFALNEAKKMAIAGESAAAYAARQDAIADKIRAVNQLETDLENKFQAKYIADLAARAQADADYQTKLRGLLESQAEYRADLESKKSTDQREAPKSFLSDMVAAGKANSFVGPKTEDQTAKDKKVLEDYADGVKELARNIGSGIASVMSEAIASVASGSKSALDALGGMLGGIVMMLGQMLIQLGTAALVASALSAIPFFAPLVGGPAAAGAGAAAIIAGGIMVAAGAGLNSAIGMASGGLVLAGSPNFDSVPALLQRGEYVIPAAQVRENVRSGRAPDDSGKAGGGGGGVSISVTQQSFVPGTKADFNRSVRDAVLPAIQQLARQGLLNLRGG